MTENTINNSWEKNNLLNKFKETRQTYDKDRLIREVVKNLKNNDFKILAVRKMSLERGYGEADISYKGLEHPLIIDWHSSLGWSYPTPYDFYFNYYFNNPYKGTYKDDYRFIRDMNQSHFRFWFDDPTQDEIRALDNVCNKIKKFIKDSVK